jgi:hypothetical protein
MLFKPVCKYCFDYTAILITRAVYIYFKFFLSFLVRCWYISLRLYSKSSLTLNVSGDSNLSSSWVSMLFLNSWRVSSHIVQGTTLTLQLFKNNSGTQEKLRLNLHSLSVSELLEYGRKTFNRVEAIDISSAHRLWDEQWEQQRLKFCFKPNR